MTVASSLKIGGEKKASSRTQRNDSSKWWWLSRYNIELEGKCMDTSQVEANKLAHSMSWCSVGSHGFCNL